MSVNVELSIGPIGFTDYILVVVRRVTDPTNEVTRQSFGPAPTSMNVVFTGLDPVTYYFDFRDSVDGVDLGTLIATYLVDAKSNQVILERRFYTTGGAGPNDPVDGANTIVDPYFDNLSGTVASVFKEGFRPLEPEVEWTIVTDTITVTDGTVFSTGEKIVVDIIYKSQLPGSSNTGLFTGIELLTVDTAIDATHYNKRLNCQAVGSTMVHTFPALVTIPEDTIFYFNSFGGAQIQTKILLTGADKIRWDGFDFTPYELGEFWISKGEWVWFQKRSDAGTPYLEVIQSHHGITMVGEQLSSEIKMPNTLMEDASIVYDGDEYPRLWWWIKNRLPGTHYLTDDNVINIGYVPAIGRSSQFVVHSSLKKFRLPNTQGLVRKGMLSFTIFNTDVNRGYDYPGGWQNHALLEHDHIMPHGRCGGVNNSDPDGGGWGYSNVINDRVTLQTGGPENQVKNQGVINLRRI